MKRGPHRSDRYRSVRKGAAFLLSVLITAFSNGIVSGFLSLVRTCVVLIICLFVLTALFSGYGLWSAWPAAEFISCIITAIFLRKYRGKYNYA